MIASATLSANAPESRIVEEVLFLGRKAERAHELQTVEVLATASAKGEHGVTTLPETLAALNTSEFASWSMRKACYSRDVCAGNATLFSRPTP